MQIERTRIADIADPVTRTRAMLHHEIALLRRELAETGDSAVYAETADELERAEDALASLDMCFA